MKKGFVASLLIAGTIAAAPAAHATGFADVLPTNPFGPYIADLQQKGVVVGYNGNFNPSDQLTRAQFATMLVNAFNLPMSGHTVKFYDSHNHWGAKYIQAAYEAGAVSGTSDSTFEPDSRVRREEAAAMTWRLLIKNGVKPTSAGAPIANTDAWAQESVQNILYNHLHSVDVQDGAYRSQDTMTRQETAALLSTAMKLAPTPETIVVNPTANDSNLIDQQDGSMVLGNVQMNTSYSEAQKPADLKSHMQLLAETSFKVDGNTVTVTVPDSGSDHTWWTVSDGTNHKSWQGRGGNTMTFTSTEKVGISLYDHDTAQIFAAAAIVYADGKWTARYPK